MRVRSLLLALSLSVAATVPLRAQSPMADLIERWETAFNGGDYQAVAALYTMDAVRYRPGDEPLRGREAIAAEMTNFADVTIDLELVGSKSGGDIISAWGTYALYPREGEAEEPVQNGPWMNVAVKGQDGSWKIYRDIWNFRQQP